MEPLLPDDLPTSSASYRYWAFISYSHQDRQWAEWIHRSLERFRLPPKMLSESGLQTPKTLYPVFIDRAELASASTLETRLQEALNQSRYLIVVCSPNAANSKWVDQEIRTFKAAGRSDKILCLIVAGEPQISKGQESAPQECFPASIRFSVGSDKELLHDSNDPIAADLRPAGDGKKLALLKLVAGILNVPLSTLTQRHQQQNIRRLRWLSAMLTIAVLGFSLLAWQAYTAKKVSERLYLQSLSSQLAVNSNTLFNNGNSLRVNALLGGVEALRIFQTPEAKSAALKVLQKTENIQHIFTTGTSLSQIKISSDGRYLVAAGWDHKLRLWDIQSGQRSPAILDGHQDKVLTIAFSPDGETLASGGVDGRLLLWDIKTQQIIKALDQHQGWISSIHYSPDGALFASASWDGTVRVWSAAENRPIAQLDTPLGAWASSVSFSPSGDQLATGWDDGAVRIWSRFLGPDPNVTTLQGHNGWVTGIVFNQVDSEFLTTGSDGVINVWDMKHDRERPEHILRGHQDGVSSGSYTRDGLSIVSAGWDRQILRWDRGSGVIIDPPLLGHTGQVSSIAQHPTQPRFFTASLDGSIIQWRDEQQGLGQTRSHSPAQVSGLSLDSRRNRIVSIGSDGSVAVWNPDTATAVSPARGLHGELTAVAYSPDSEWLLVGDAKGDISLIDSPGALPRLQLTTEQRGAVTGIGVSPDGKTVALGDANGLVYVYPVASIARRTRLDGHVGPITAVSFSPDSTLLVTSSNDETVRLWDLKSKRQLGEPLVGNGTPLTTVAFSPVDRILVAGDEDGTLTFWKPERGVGAGVTIKAHQGAVTAVVFSPDGTMLASGGSDSEVRLWDVVSHQPIGLPLKGHEERVLSLVFSNQGEVLVSGSAAGELRFWPTNVDHWQTMTCNKIFVPLTRKEWSQFIGSFIPYSPQCVK